MGPKTRNSSRDLNLGTLAYKLANKPRRSPYASHFSIIMMPNINTANINRHQFYFPPATKLFPNKILKSTFNYIERRLQVQFVWKLSWKGKSQNLLRSYIYSIIDWVDSSAIETLLFVEVVYIFVTQLDDTHVRFASHPRLDPRPRSPAKANLLRNFDVQDLRPRISINIFSHTSVGLLSPFQLVMIYQF